MTAVESDTVGTATARAGGPRVWPYEVAPPGLLTRDRLPQLGHRPSLTI